MAQMAGSPLVCPAPKIQQNILLHIRLVTPDICSQLGFLLPKMKLF
jgi:hypothetical protein